PPPRRAGPARAELAALQARVTALQTKLAAERDILRSQSGSHGSTENWISTSAIYLRIKGV
ncbi:MAG: hypothetical protein WBP61_11255, partial [Nocardioides sp.]